MNKHFDKLLLVLALLAVAGAAWFWYGENKDRLAGRPAPVRKQTAETAPEPFTSVVVPKVPDTSVAWREPVTDLENEKTADWTFDLFTPVQIFWTQARSYFPKGAPLIPDPPFGVSLLAMERPAYRLVLRGDFGNRVSVVDSEARDARTGERRSGTYTLEKGKTYSAPPVTVTDILREKKRSANGVLQENITLLVRDNELKRDFRLRLGVPVYLDKHFIKLRADATGETWTWQKVGPESAKSIAGVGDFSLKAFDFERNSVTILKKYKKMNRARKLKPAEAEVTLWLDDSSGSELKKAGASKTGAATSSTSAGAAAASASSAKTPTTNTTSAPAAPSAGAAK